MHSNCTTEGSNKLICISEERVKEWNIIDESTFSMVREYKTKILQPYKIHILSKKRIVWYFVTPFLGAVPKPGISKPGKSFCALNFFERPCFSQEQVSALAQGLGVW